MNIAVIGLGKLGLPLAVLQAQNHRVYGIDSNSETAASIQRGHSPVREPGVDLLLSQVRKSGNFTAHNDYINVAECDMSLIIVPTPSLPDGSFTSEFVLEAVRNIGKVLNGGVRPHLVVVCSTVMPGQCETDIRDALEETSDRCLGQTLGLIYSPEFIALGTVLRDMQRPAMTLIGAGTQWEVDLYTQVCPDTAPVVVMSRTSAEIAKISLNAYITMKISFANILSELCELYPDADAHHIARGIGLDPRVGSKYIEPGGPYGGPCFPRDNRAFAKTFELAGISNPIPYAVDHINRWQIERIAEKILAYDREAVSILGLSYKPGAPILEESLGYHLTEYFLGHGERTVRVFDTLIGKPALYPEQNPFKAGAPSWFTEPNGMFSNDSVTVITIPDPELISRIPAVFETASRSQSIVIDPWDCIPRGPWHQSHIITLGVS